MASPAPRVENASWRSFVSMVTTIEGAGHRQPRRSPDRIASKASSHSGGSSRVSTETFGVLDRARVSLAGR